MKSLAHIHEWNEARSFTDISLVIACSIASTAALAPLRVVSIGISSSTASLRIMKPSLLAPDDWVGVLTIIWTEPPLINDNASGDIFSEIM